jgi:chorismate synthase
MAADPVDPDELAGLARNAPLTRPRPGHADLAGMQKYGFDEARPILERASARETAARVALGEVAKALPQAGARHRDRLATCRAGPVAPRPRTADPGARRRRRLDADPVRCLDPDASASAMVAEIDAGPEGRRHPRRRRRGAGYGCRRASARTCTGTAGSTPGWPPR